MFEGVYVIIGNPAFSLFLYLTGVHFRGELQHVGDVCEQKIKCRPIRTREIGGVILSDVLYGFNRKVSNYWLYFITLWINVSGTNYIFESLH